MNKKLVGLALTVAMMFGVASMASAAVKFKFGAWMRYRGVLTDNQDRLDTTDGVANRAKDDWKYYDQVFRPYFKASTDYARMYFQLDIPKFNLVGGEDGSNFGTGLVAFSDFGRTDVSVVTYKLSVKVPAVPGNWWVTLGYDNVFLPRGLVGRLPALREFGIQLKGSLGIFKPQIEIWKRDESSSGTLGLSFADDDDIYIGKLAFAPMKGVRILPYLVYHEQNATASRSEKITNVYAGISASARHKVFSGKADFVYQSGTDRKSVV